MKDYTLTTIIITFILSHLYVFTCAVLYDATGDIGYMAYGLSGFAALWVIWYGIAARLAPKDSLGKTKTG